MLFFILRRQKDEETVQKEKNLRHCEMKEQSVDNKEANWYRMNSAVKRISQASFGKTASHMRWQEEFGVFRISKKQESVFSVSEVDSLLTTTQVLQMRGGADTEEKMGHEWDASPHPRAMCWNFQLNAHCQVCQHQLLACGSAAASLVQQKGTRRFRRKCKPQSCGS